MLCRLTVGGRQNSHASTVRNSTRTRLILTRQCRAPPFSGTMKSTSTKNPAIYSKEFNDMPNMSLKKNEMPNQPAEERIKNFDEVALGYSPEAAIDEAKRCLDCKHKPCVAGCPVNIRIPDFIREITKAILRRPTGLSHSQALCPPSAAGSARRRISARQNVTRHQGKPVAIGRQAVCGGFP